MAIIVADITRLAVIPTTLKSVPVIIREDVTTYTDTQATLITTIICGLIYCVVSLL